MRIARNIILPLLVLPLFWMLVGCQSGVSPQTTIGEPSFELEVDILGKSHTLLLDGEGRLLTETELASTDGALILFIDRGTRLLDRAERPLSSIQVNIEQELLTQPDSAHIISAVYSFKPHDATFDLPLELTIRYDPQELPKGTRESDMCITPYDEDSGWGKYSYKRVDTEKHRVTTQINRMARYAVLAPMAVTNPTNSGDASGDNSSPDMLEVVYFHRPQRCSGCVYAETVTRYTLENYFADELANRTIVFKAINLGDKANAAIIEHYGAYTSSLFINSIKGGIEHIEEVTEIWFLLGKDSEFVALVKSKIDYYLNREQS